MFVEKDSGFTVPFRCFLSNGTAPDTGLSNDSMRGSSNGAAQFTVAAKISAVSANAGMYAVVLSASETSVLGNVALWYDQGDFPQHIATLEVINSNNYSSMSNIAAKTYSGVTVGSLATLVPTDYSSLVTVGVGSMNKSVGATSGLSFTPLPGDYSSIVTVGVGNMNKSVGGISGLSFTPVPGDYSSIVTVGVGNINKTVFAASGVSIAPAPGTYSNVSLSVSAIDKAVGATSGLSFIPTPGDYSSKVTVGIGTIAGGDYSNVTISGLDSGVSVKTGGIVAASFAASAVDATALATNAENAIADALLARNVAGGSSSGRIVSEALYGLRNKVAIDGSIGTVYQVNDTSSAWTFSIGTVSTNSGLIQVIDPG